MVTASVDGLVSGLSTSDLIGNLMRVERAPQDRLRTRVTQANAIVSTYQTLNARFVSVADAAKVLTASTGFAATRGTTSDSSTATVTTKPESLPASLAFSVDRLATSHALTSAGTVTGTDAVIAPANSKVLIGAARSIGVGPLSSQTALTTGEHTLVVTQATGAASHDGAIVGSSVTIGAGATLEIATDGSAATTQTISLTAGTYTRSQLAQMVTAASGGSLSATVDGDGSIKLATTAEGSTAQLAITGGSALGALGHSTTAVASGTDGIVTLDGVANTITSAGPGQAVTFNGAAGATLAATLSGGLRTGTSRFALIDVGSGSLSSVVSAVNSVAAGVSASAVQVGSGVYRLQLAARATGTAGALSVDPAAFSGLGTLDTLTTAQDAQLTVGSGSSAYTITSSSNDAEVLAGVNVRLLKTSTSPVTVDVAVDSGAVADKVAALVDGLNGALNFIRTQSAYDATRRTGGPLLGDSLARQLQQQVYGTTGTAPASNGLSLGQIGISVNRDGTVAFDRAKFETAFASRPTDVKAVLGSGTTGSPGFAKIAETLAAGATDATDGLITSAINGAKSQVTTLTNQVTSWDQRLVLKERTLRRQFGDMETRLGNLRNQSTWLSGQIAQLPSYS
jgi:flagellar hook-associated protein 2